MYVKNLLTPTIVTGAFYYPVGSGAAAASGKIFPSLPTTPSLEALIRQSSDLYRRLDAGK
jgi:hypothetical protein